MYLNQAEVQAAQDVIYTYTGYVLKNASLCLPNLAKHLPDGMVTEVVVTSSFMPFLSKVHCSSHSIWQNGQCLLTEYQKPGKKKKLQITFFEKPMQSFFFFFFISSE